MKRRTRGRWGVQSGLMAGIAVAALFFVVDLVRGSPLATPLRLSRRLLESTGPALEGGGVIQAAAGLSPGGRLAVFTVLHLAVFMTLGICAAAISNVFPIRWSSRTGAVVGIVVAAVVWLLALRLGSVALAEARLTPEAVVGAGIVGGAVLGWHLRLCHLDAEDASSRRT